MRRSFIIAGFLAAAALGVGGVAQGSQSTADGNDKAGADAPRKALATSANDVTVMGIWRNGKFHVVKFQNRRHLVELPDGAGEEINVSPSVAEIEAQLPRVDPAMAHVKPTQQQIDDMKAQVDKDSASVKARMDNESRRPTGPAGPESRLPGPTVP